MNADSTDTRSSHLDLGDLIAEAAGQPIGDRARRTSLAASTANSRRAVGTSLPAGSGAWPLPRRR
jgi:hypothetical protein